MVEFMKRHFLTKVIGELDGISRAFTPCEYPPVIEYIENGLAFDGTTDMINRLEREEISCSPLLVLTTRYPYIYQNIIQFVCIKLFRMGVFESPYSEQRYVLTDMPEWGNYYQMSSGDEDDVEALAPSREKLIKTMMNEAGWIMQNSFVEINPQYIEDDDSLYRDIIDQVCHGSEKYETVLRAAEKDNNIKEVILDYIAEEELEELNMLVFVSDREYPLGLLQDIFDDFICGQVTFYLKGVNGVIILYPDSIEEGGLTFTIDASSINLISVLYAYYASLINPFKRIGMRSAL